MAEMKESGPGAFGDGEGEEEGEGLAPESDSEDDEVPPPLESPTE